VAGSCIYGNEPAGSGAMYLISYLSVKYNYAMLFLPKLPGDHHGPRGEPLRTTVRETLLCGITVIFLATHKKKWAIN
jgi:hypothetical protein